MEIVLEVNGKRKCSYLEYYHGQVSPMEFVFSEAFDPTKIDRETGVFAVEPEVLEQRLRPALYLLTNGTKRNKRGEEKAIKSLKRLVAEYRLAKQEKLPARLMIFY